jgi:hypothetical protein
MRLATETIALESFEEDPEAAMTAARLTPDQKAAVRSQDPRRLSSAVLSEYGAVGAQSAHTWPIVIIILKR